MLCVQWVIGHLFLFLLLKISISTLEKYDFFISLSTLESRDQYFKFLFLLSKFEIGISHFSFYSRNSRSESQISLSTLEIRDQNFKFLFLRIYFFDSRQCHIMACRYIYKRASSRFKILVICVGVTRLERPKGVD